MAFIATKLCSFMYAMVNLWNPPYAQVIAGMTNGTGNNVIGGGGSFHMASRQNGFA